MELDQSNDNESFTCQLRSQPIVHPPVDSIACADCQRLEADVALFDPTCAGCQELLYDDSSNISHMFALLRQWSPRIQQHAEMIIRQVINLWLYNIVLGVDKYYNSAEWLPQQLTPSFGI